MLNSSKCKGRKSAANDGEKALVFILCNIFPCFGVRMEAKIFLSVGAIPYALIQGWERGMLGEGCRRSGSL
eukprot:760452-Ditylum_brightwellii.AAC.1